MALTRMTSGKAAGMDWYSSGRVECLEEEGTDLVCDLKRGKVERIG